MTEKQIIEFPVEQEQGTDMEFLLDDMRENIAIASMIDDYAKKEAKKLAISSLHVVKRTVSAFLSGENHNLSEFSGDEEDEGKEFGPSYYGIDVHGYRYELQSIFELTDEGIFVFFSCCRVLPDGKKEMWVHSQEKWIPLELEEKRDILWEDDELMPVYTPYQEKLLRSGSAAGDFLRIAADETGGLTDQEFYSLRNWWNKLLDLYNRVHSFMQVQDLLFYEELRDEKDFLEALVDKEGFCFALEPADLNREGFFITCKGDEFLLYQFLGLDFLYDSEVDMDKELDLDSLVPVLRLVDRTKSLKTAEQLLLKMADRYTKTDVVTVPLSFEAFTESVSLKLLGNRVFYTDENRKQMTEKEKERLQELKWDVNRMLEAANSK